MDGMDLLMTRRSVRGFLKKEVDKDLIKKICDAGLHAPTGRNRQSTIIIAITDPEVRRRLTEVNAEIMGASGTDTFYGAPVILVVLARKDARTYIYDGGACMENLLLAAHEVGLAGCWIHRAKEEFEMPEFQELLKGLGIADPENYEGIGHCAIGYPADLARPREINEGRLFFIS
ncbi:MAG: nitroreductase [Clostridia bacterium]|nr:nitroreductase [Clostridia bacterium]